METKEATEYDEALKNLHELSLKKAMSEEGIDTSKVSKKTFDEIKRLVDKQSLVRQKYQQISTKAQQDMQKEVQEIQKGIGDAVKQIKIEQGIIQEEKPPEAEAPGAVEDDG